MRLLDSQKIAVGSVSGAKNSTTINADQGGVLALNLACQISFTGSSESASSAQLFKSNDGTNWVAEGNTVTISGASGVIWLEKQNNTALYWRIQYACGGGSFTPTEQWNLMG